MWYTNTKKATTGREKVGDISIIYYGARRKMARGMDWLTKYSSFCQLLISEVLFFFQILAPLSKSAPFIPSPSLTLVAPPFGGNAPSRTCCCIRPRVLCEEQAGHCPPVLDWMPLMSRRCGQNNSVLTPTPSQPSRDKPQLGAGPT